MSEAGQTERTAKSWAEVVGKLPARILTFAAALALIAFLLLIAVTLFAYWRGDSITIAGADFGKTKPPVAEGTSLTLTEIASLKSLLGRLILAPSGATCLDNPNLQFKFCFETDGNLVGYDKSKSSSKSPNGNPIWGTMTK
jgi:hypothetical protein